MAFQLRAFSCISVRLRTDTYGAYVQPFCTVRTNTYWIRTISYSFVTLCVWFRTVFVHLRSNFVGIRTVSYYFVGSRRLSFAFALSRMVSCCSVPFRISPSFRRWTLRTRVSNFIMYGSYVPGIPIKEAPRSLGLSFASLPTSKSLAYVFVPGAYHFVEIRRDSYSFGEIRTDTHRFGQIRIAARTFSYSRTKLYAKKN